MSADLSSGSPPFLLGVLKTVHSWLVALCKRRDPTVIGLDAEKMPPKGHYYLTEDGAPYYPDQWGSTSFPRRYLGSEVRVLLKSDDREITHFKLDAKRILLTLDY